MSYEADITQAIKDSAPLWEAINGCFSWDVADSSKSPPYLVAQTITESGDTTHDGSRDVTFPTIQFSAWAKTKAEAVNISALLTSCLEGQSLPGDSAIALRFDSRNSTYDAESRLFGIVTRFDGSAQI